MVDYASSYNGPEMDLTLDRAKEIYNVLMDVEEVSTDGTLADNSDVKVSTQKAIKTYVEAKLDERIKEPTGDTQGLGTEDDVEFNSIVLAGDPFFVCRAWVNFDGTTADNLSGTYVRTGTEVVVTLAVTHGYLVGHDVYADFTSGTAADNIFTITAVDAVAKTITFTHGTSGDTNGNVTLNRRLIRASANVHSVTYQGTGIYVINFLSFMADANYATLGGGRRNADAGVAEASPQISFSNYTTGKVKMGCQDNDGNTYENGNILTAAIFR